MQLYLYTGGIHRNKILPLKNTELVLNSLMVLSLPGSILIIKIQ